MKHQIHELEVNLQQFQLILNNINLELVKWKKDEKSWCYLEVVCHLLDEEKEDFKARMASIMTNPEGDLKSIDPVGWVLSRDYINQDYKSVCEAFFKERKSSLEFLKNLDADDPGWLNVKKHPHFGDLSPLFMLNNWVAHDLLHLRQLTRIRYDYLKSISSDPIDYAGTWK
ncbi:MAG: hypothetical protein HKO66_09355 [Saprospiraceae bacterium]|nr:DinB family protein [Bacteroidia bacterium]NNE15461.1 hypothetical protein [Saprospiraceae bacterium]NNL92424.1 hypothetical protein [Saprospiraceae bacterium]